MSKYETSRLEKNNIKRKKIRQMNAWRHNINYKEGLYPLHVLSQTVTHLELTFDPKITCP